ncbi:hypothetical protein FVEG_12055 [Fusarium verticillioides 7600]|uniref:Uncharacterized protein n=1 Tax=Gibberella moniliformis (strain M3125 / FGSC 7600) TaxID=334819 RepID=W7N0J0_GIBM7|nr:hypothetical protein FVEG_12055 [Fusarium verticillioides 7600]EWG53675.1 hypothetical protein FVEG_12055 [Fusarium verticillioides 7600]
MDREAFKTEFRRKVPVLDIDHTTFWLLQPFFNWAGLQGRYLMSNIGSISNEFVTGTLTVTPPYIHPMRENYRNYWLWRRVLKDLATMGVAQPKIQRPMKYMAMKMISLGNSAH